MNTELIQKGIDILVQYAPRVVGAIVILIVGSWIIKKMVNLTVAVLQKRKVDETLIPFFRGLISVTLKIVLFISVAELVGVKTTSLVAVLGAAGLAVGLALQGSLSNFAGGALILLFKPYKKGDLIEAQGELGVVDEIQIFNTILISPENKKIILPNAAVSNGTIKNFTEEGQLRVDLVVGIGYGEDIKKAKEIILDVLQKDDKVLKDPVPSVNVLELADSSVNLAVRPFAKPEHYWDVYFGTLETVKYALDSAEIEIPFPQQVTYEYKMGNK